MSSTPENTILAGRFSGDGQWTDITGESKRYRIDFLEFGKDGGLITLSFVHDLYEENDRVDAEFCFEFENESRFALLSSKETGHARIGTGYAFDGYCRQSRRSAGGAGSVERYGLMSMPPRRW